MKRFVYLALAMLMPGMLLAAPVKKDAAKMKAAAFLQQKIAATSGRRAPQKLSLVSNEPEGAAYYIFNNASEGFAIVAGDDRFGDIIGYSEEGTFDVDRMPEALRLTLEDYAAAVKFAQENNIEVKKAPRKAERASVEPFVKYQWDQGTPFNNNCPSDGKGGHCSTGCMAVSLATIIAHFKYPETLPECYGYVSSDHSDAYSYDYSAFKTTYSSSYGAGEIPQFMYHVANLLSTHYEASGSGAQLSKMVPTLKSLGYNKNIRAVRRDAYSAEDWDELMYAELAAGRPINFMGEHTDLGGHSYICDGYRASDGFYHILWGWGTNCVGYYDINILNPFIEYISQWGRMGYTCPPAGFTGGLQAIIGIQTTDTENASAFLLTTDDITRDGSSSVRATLFNWNDDTFRGQLTWAILGETEGTFSRIEGLTPQNVNSVSYKSYMNSTLNLANLGLAEGTYRLAPICKTNDESADWNLCEGFRQKYVEVTVKNGEVSYVAHPVFDVVVDNIVYKAATGNYLELILTLRNEGDDAYGYLNLSAVRDDGTRLDGSKMDIAVKAGEKQILSVFVEHGGSYSSHTYDVAVEYMKHSLGKTVIDPSVSTSSLSYYLKYDGVDFEDYGYDAAGNAMLYSTTLKGNLKVKNESSYYKYNLPVRMTLTDDAGNVVYQRTSQQIIGNGESKSYPIEVNNLQANKVYKLTAQAITVTRNQSIYKESVTVDFFSDFAITVKVGIPYYTATGSLERMTPEGTGATDLPENTAAVDFSKFDASLVNLSSIKNENCLYIFPAGATVPAELEGKNVVVGGVAEKLTLVDESPVVFPIDFTAQEATYKRTFEKFNNGDDQGWNTIVLPFAARVTVDGSNVDWFHSKSESGRKFWLYKYTNGVGGTVYFDYEANTTMAANEPYLLAVPGDKWGEKYDLHNKEFTFHGENVTVKGNAKAEKAGGEYILRGSYANAPFTYGYQLNAVGDFFELTEDATEKPFRAYFATTEDATSTSARVLRVAHSSTDGIEQIGNSQLTNENAPIYNLNGQRIEQLQRGVNIVGGKKMMVK